MPPSPWADATLAKPPTLQLDLRKPNCGRSNVRVTNDCRGLWYNDLPSAAGAESVAFRNSGCGEAEQQEDEEEEVEEATEVGGGIGSGLVGQDEMEQSGPNNTMQHPKPQLRKLKFVPELEGIEEVSEDDEQREEEEDCEVEEEDASANDNNGVKLEVKEGGQQQQQQQQNVHAAGDADCLAVVLEVNIANCRTCAVVAARDREVIQMTMPVPSAGRRRPPRWRSVDMSSLLQPFISLMTYPALFSFTLLTLDAYTLLDHRERKPIRRRLGYIWRKFVCCGNLPASA
nr:unnamed protein product [Spirometra erinaceieuropaei]